MAKVVKENFRSENWIPNLKVMCWCFYAANISAILYSYILEITNLKWVAMMIFGWTHFLYWIYLWGVKALKKKVTRETTEKEDLEIRLKKLNEEMAKLN